MRAFQVIKRLLRDQTGATAIEYGLIASLVVIAIVGAMSTLGNETNDMWTEVATTVESYM